MDNLKIEIIVKGTAPLIMHSSQTADPTNQYAKSLKKISSKRSKTDEDYEEMASIEYDASLYRDNERFPGTGLYMPTENVIACLINAGKKIKHGRGSMKAAVTGFLVDDAIGVPLYTKYSTYEEMRADDDTWFKKIVNVQSNKIVRTRVLLNEWRFIMTGELETSYCDLDMLQEMLTIAGRIIGLGDWRPSSGTPGAYGKFEAFARKASGKKPEDIMKEILENERKNEQEAA